MEQTDFNAACVDKSENNHFAIIAGMSGALSAPAHKDCLTPIPELIKKRAIDRPRLGCETLKNFAALDEPGIRPGKFAMR
jgi:hypothetical protein